MAKILSKILPKIVVILGPTASGKTELGIKLAKKYKGEIVSVDSRQVYKEMSIATGKPVGENKDGHYLIDGIQHHLMNIINPDEEFSVADFKERAQRAITDILSRGKLPIVVGGTGLYIWSIVDNLDIPKVKVDKKLRSELEEKSLADLVKMLKTKDPDSAVAVDLKNKRRVVRALEVVIISGKSFCQQKKVGSKLYNALQIGLNWPKAQLEERISRRIDRQFEAGLIEETKKLIKKYPFNLPSMSGIGYREVASYLNGEINLVEAIRIITNRTLQYAKRQITWFKRDPRIKWINPSWGSLASCFKRHFVSQ